MEDISIGHICLNFSSRYYYNNLNNLTNNIYLPATQDLNLNIGIAFFHLQHFIAVICINGGGANVTPLDSPTIRDSDGVNRIVNGTVAKQGQWPYMVSNVCFMHPFQKIDIQLDAQITL